jgi:hypothetical protein
MSVASSGRGAPRDEEARARLSVLPPMAVAASLQAGCSLGNYAIHESKASALAAGRLSPVVMSSNASAGQGAAVGKGLGGGDRRA